MCSFGKIEKTNSREIVDLAEKKFNCRLFQLMSILLTYKYGIVYYDNIKLVEVAFFI